ncbi:amidinotransferase [Streptomyces sp. NPDC002537]
MPAVVCSYNEWDPLEEVVVGRVDGAMTSSWDVIDRVTVPAVTWPSYGAEERRGTPMPEEAVEKAERALEEFLGILHEARVTVRRPEPHDFGVPFASPAWSVGNGLSVANPRDSLLVVGDEIIEVPMADRGRYFETWPYRPLLTEYFRAGARWTAAPKPRLLDAQYREGYELRPPGDGLEFITTELEPVFDAADVMRCGRDLFMERSHVTNGLGLEWLRRHLGPGYRVHEVFSRCPRAMHIDTSLLPLAPGKVLVNPEFLDPDQLPEVFRSWDVLIPPEPVVTPVMGQSLISRWSSLNVLMLDPGRVVVERAQEPLLKAFEQWGFDPVPCSFEDYTVFGGSFHCATLDVRRRGGLESYF